MNPDYFSYDKKDTTPMEDKDPLWSMEGEEYKEPTMVQWGMIQENNKPNLYTTNNTITANTEPLLIPNNGAKGSHKPKKNNNKRMAHTFPNTINNDKFGEWTKEEKRKSQPTFLFTVGSLQKEEGPVPWPAKLVSKSHEKQRRRQNRSNGYNKSASDEQEDMIFTMEDA
ncbi:hypothetical protein K501DRAFT_284519 [Backusella circina FSU 941]|nr:hypothetical protein K501DRAFT_284519 [Backusella circina FSU 941]